MRKNYEILHNFELFFVIIKDFVKHQPKAFSTMLPMSELFIGVSANRLINWDKNGRERILLHSRLFFYSSSFIVIHLKFALETCTESMTTLAEAMFKNQNDNEEDAIHSFIIVDLSVLLSPFAGTKKLKHHRFMTLELNFPPFRTSFSMHFPLL